jgi:glycerol-3-phosphate dehydrogenase
MRFEWAQTADDVLWRRSKLGLGLAKADAQRLAHFMAGATAGADQA